MKKRVFCVLLTICMIAGLFPTAVFADDPEPTAGLKITYSSTVTDTTKVTIKNEGLTGAYPFVIKENSETLKFGTLTFIDGEAHFKISEGQTLEVTGLPNREYDIDTYVLSTASYSELIMGSFFEINIVEESPELISDLELSKTSGNGWTYEDDTLTIEKGYRLDSTSEIKCKKLVVNGVLNGGNYPDTVEISGNGVILAGSFPNKKLNVNYGIMINGGKFANEDIYHNFIIMDAAQLEDFAYSVNSGENFAGKTITLGADIDLSNVTHLPIGDEDNNFFGTFDGNGHTITLGSVSASFQSGLFGCVGEGAVVKNLNVKGSLKFAMAGQKSNFYYLGSIAGYVDYYAMVYNCISDVEFNIESNVNLTVGGLVGFLGGSLLNSAFNGKLTTSDNIVIGALVGETGIESVVGNCYSATYPDLIGGTSPKMMKHCYAIADSENKSDDAIALPSIQMTADSGTINGDGWSNIDELGYIALVDVLNHNLDTIDEEMSDLDLKPWVNDKKNGRPVFGQVIYPEPQITIIDNLYTIINLTEGYTDTTVYEFEIVGEVNAEISGDGDYIKFDDNDNKMTISPGLKAGTYTLVLTASSGSYQDAMLTITIDVSEKQCNHSFEWIIDKEPTYTSTGLKYKKCTICHEIQNENTIIDKLEKDDIPIIISNAFVCFETNGGSKIDRLMTLFGSKVDLMKYIPERDGYEFDGWYSDKELTKFVTSIRAVGVTTVYAKWVREALPFVDVDTESEYYDDIAFVYNNGLMIGTSDLTFSPEMTLTRGMVVTILWRINGSPVVNYAMDFTDVSPDDYYAEAVRWAQSEKIVNGIGDKLFDPDSPVTREQLAAIIYRCVQRNGGGFTGMWYFPLNYADASEISSYADEAMHWCVMNGIIESDDDNNLRPTAPASRAETARAYHIFSIIYGLD